MVLIGYLAFLDPPKESTADAIRALKAHGVITKILTGDNDKVTRTICKQVGLEVRNMLLGSDLDHMTDGQLAKAVETTEVFAKLTPDQKARVVSVLRENGHTVGFISHSHDSHTKASVYPEPCISTGNIAYHDRYCSSDCDSVHTIWSCTWSCCFTGIIFCISDPMYSAVHDAGNKLEKSICPLLWRTALGGRKNELERIMDDTFWNL